MLGHLEDRGVLIDLVQLLVELLLALLAFNHSPRLAKLSYGASAPKRLDAALVEHLTTWSEERLVEGGVLLAQVRGVIEAGKVQVGAWLMSLLLLVLHRTHLM